MTTFRPQLFPNEAIKVEDMPDGQYLVSFKLDGIRCIFKDGEMLSRSLKPIPNIRLQEKFDHLKRWVVEQDTVLDGELYAHDLTFQEITSIVMSQDKEVPESVRFHCFDALPAVDNGFGNRILHIPQLKDLVKVAQVTATKSDFERLMEGALEAGFEGLIIRHPLSGYKHGRVTVKSGDGFKLKPYQTFDARIIGFVQATEVREGTERKINELGYSETSKKKDDRMPVNKLAAFLVNYQGKELKVVYAATDEEKTKAWQDRFNLHGRMIEYKAMLLGAKDLPRHPVWLRFREDRE